MIPYNECKSIFKKWLGDYFFVVDFFDTSDGFRSHTALGWLLAEMLETYKNTKLPELVIGLVTDLFENGDEGCKNLVFVSFFENMNGINESDLNSIYGRFNPNMKKAMVQTLQEFGYEEELAMIDLRK